MSERDLSKPVFAALAVAGAGALLAATVRKRGEKESASRTNPKTVKYVFLNDGLPYSVPLKDGDTLEVSVQDPQITIAFEIEVKHGAGSRLEVAVATANSPWSGVLAKKKHRATVFIITCGGPEFLTNVKSCQGCIGADVG